VPCETQDPPDLDAGAPGSAPETSPAPATTRGLPGQDPLIARYGEILRQMTDAKQLKSAGSVAAAKQLVDQALEQLTAWSKDWASFQKGHGVEPTLAVPLLKGANR
jgi:hypothetical protein